jgi:hypothetical protein
MIYFRETSLSRVTSAPVVSPRDQLSTLPTVLPFKINISAQKHEILLLKEVDITWRESEEV